MEERSSPAGPLEDEKPSLPDLSSISLKYITTDGEDADNPENSENEDTPPELDDM